MSAELKRSVQIEETSSVTVDVHWLLRSNSSPTLEVIDSSSRVLNLRIAAKSADDFSSMVFDLDAGNYQIRLSNFTPSAIIGHITFKTSQSRKKSNIYFLFFQYFFSFQRERFGKNSWMSIFYKHHHRRKSYIGTNSFVTDLQYKFG